MNPNLDYQQLSRNLLETNIRPVRIGFLLGSNPSKRLVGSVLKINTGLWGGIYNLVCPTDGRLIPDYLLSLLKVSNLDFIAFCGNFQQRARVFDQLNSSGLDADLLKISLDKLEKFGIGIEGTLNGWFTQMIQRVFVPRIGIVDTRKGEADLIDDFVFGVIPQRIKEYFEDRADFISVGRYHRERNKAGSEYDRLIGLLELSDRHIERIVRSLGRTRPLMYSLFLRRQRVIVFGDRNDLLDSCYFWNVRAIFGKDNVSWLPAEQAMAIVSDTKVSQRSGSAESTRPIFLTCLSATLATDIENGIKNLVQPKQYRYRQPGDILRRVPVVSFSADRKIEQLVAHDRIAVVSTSMPRAFIMEYPKTPRWALDVRVLRDRSLGAEGLVLPNLPGIRRILTPNLGGSAPSIRGDVFSFHVSPRTQQVALRMPTDWEVLGAILQRHYPNVALSDQGRYMSLTTDTGRIHEASQHWKRQ